MSRHLRHLLAPLTLFVGLTTFGCEKQEIEPVAEGKAPAAAAAAAAGADEAPIPDDQSGEGLSEGGHFWVRYTPAPNPIPFQDHFAIDVGVYAPDDRGRLLTDVELDEVRADMPAHNHGMKVKPIVEKSDDGSFRVDGMRFHMGGEGKHGRWVIAIVARRGEVVDQASFPVQCCKALEGAAPSHPLP